VVLGSLKTRIDDLNLGRLVQLELSTTQNKAGRGDTTTQIYSGYTIELQQFESGEAILLTVSKGGASLRHRRYDASICLAARSSERDRICMFKLCYSHAGRRNPARCGQSDCTVTAEYPTENGECGTNDQTM
jgi:uncharacterized low-complexity protein